MVCILKNKLIFKIIKFTGRFSISGIPNTFIGFISLRLLLNINYFLAISVSELLGQIVKYYSHKYFFRSVLKPHLKFKVAFIRAYLLTFIVNAMIGFGLTFVITNLNILALVLTILPIIISMIITFISYEQYE